MCGSVQHLFVYISICLCELAFIDYVSCTVRLKLMLLRLGEGYKYCIYNAEMEWKLYGKVLES